MPNGKGVVKKNGPLSHVTTYMMLKRNFWFSKFFPFTFLIEFRGRHWCRGFLHLWPMGFLFLLLPCFLAFFFSLVQI